jgi:hypothetical protein
MQIATLLAKERTNHIANGVPFIVPAQVIFLNNTFARASIATRVNAQGLVEVVPPDTPRFDHDPVPLALKCLLLEVSRINISNQFFIQTQPIFKKFNYLKQKYEKYISNIIIYSCCLN